MPELQLRVLGDLRVIRGDAALELPPSRKTRGLLAFLALSDKALRREQLCELLWEIPDDPRGSLRWSLSKIRKLVDDEGCPRIRADRSTIAFDTDSVNIDVVSLHRAAEHAASASIEELERAAEEYQGTFLAGLDLADFHDFHAWCIGERERAIRSRARVLAELGRRLADQPERALDHAIALVSLTPFEELPRADLIRILVQLDRQDEARHQLQVGREKLAEVGVQESGALSRAIRSPRRTAPPPAGTLDPAPRDVALVGREKELELLGQRINALDGSGAARMVLIRGEPGLGKSCLLLAAAVMARKIGARIFKASAFESEMIRPYGVWIDALRRGLPDNRQARQFLASEEQMTREQVFSRLVDLFRAEAENSPVVVLCDDIQWADELSLSAVHYLLRHDPGQPLLLIAAARDKELAEHPNAPTVIRDLRKLGLLDEVRLAPLSPQQIRQLIQRHFPAADAAAFTGQCGGNPLLALELARAGLEGTHSLAELVSERLSRLDANAQTVLHWAAVLAPQISLETLETSSGLDRQVIDDALEQAEKQGILHPGERGLRFSHDLIRGSLYDLISPSRRRSMHRHVAQLLEIKAGVDLDLAADLSHHARLSGDPYLAGRAMVSAARLCIRFYANDKAMDLYGQGMDFAAQLNDTQRICLTLELGEIRLQAAPVEDWQRQVDAFVQLAEAAMDHGSAPHARLGYQMASYLRWAHGEVQGAKRFSLQAERVARGGTDEAQVLGLAEAAKCLALLERDLPRADAMVMEARALAERVGFSCAAIPLGLGMLRYYEDKFDEAVDLLEDARAMSKADGDRLGEYLANEYLIMVEMERRDCAAAHRYAMSLVEIGERLREGSERPFARALEAVCRYGLTGDDSALAPALLELRMADAKQRLAFLLNRAAVQYLEHGEARRAFDFASEALDLARTMERPSEMLLACITLERIHRAAAAIAPASCLDQIAQLAGGNVAHWAKKRSEDLLSRQH